MNDLGQGSGSPKGEQKESTFAGYSSVKTDRFWFPELSSDEEMDSPERWLVTQHLGSDTSQGPELKGELKNAGSGFGS